MADPTSLVPPRLTESWEGPVCWRIRATQRPSARPPPTARAQGGMCACVCMVNVWGDVVPYKNREKGQVVVEMRWWWWGEGGGNERK